MEPNISDLEESKANLSADAPDFSPVPKPLLKADAEDFKPQGEAIIESYEDHPTPHCRTCDKFEGKYGSLNFLLGDSFTTYECLEDSWVTYSEWSHKSRAPDAKYCRGIMSAPNAFILTGGLNGGALNHSYHIEIFKDFGSVVNTMNVYEMVEARFMHGLALHNNTVYAIGGQGAPAEYLASVEAFENNNWVAKAPMNRARSFFAVIVNNSAIWVCGGFCGTAEVCQSIEKFDGRLWEVIEVALPMYAGMSVVPRDKFNSSFYVLGGSDGNRAYDRFLIFNTENSSFQEEEMKLAYPRAGSTVCWFADSFWVVGGGPSTGEMWVNGVGRETKQMPLSIYSHIEAASFMKTRE